MGGRINKTLLLVTVVSVVLLAGTEAGVVKDLYKKVSGSSNSTEDRDIVKQSAPICGNSFFSSKDDGSLSPEIIFITNRPSRSDSVSSDEEESPRRNGGRDQNVRADEYRFHVENVTLRDLKRHGFNPDGPVSFLIHGFTSGYPLQAWISGIVETYTIDRETTPSSSSSPGTSIGSGSTPNNSDEEYENYRNSSSERRRNRERERERARGKQLVNHNLFVVNWNYAARGIVYPRAVANIPIVATYLTRFINEKLIDEAEMDPRRIQLIGHSLGAHLSGFVGKNTKSKLGRIYGLDPAGPCFGALTGFLYPSSKRLAPSDAEEVITIQTNSALLGIEKPLGKYSVFVEGGAVQPGCKGGGVLKSLGSLTWDGADFDELACSHSRAPNLLTYRLDQGDSRDDCQLVAYECKDWDSFAAGHCGVCRSNSDSGLRSGNETTGVLNERSQDGESSSSYDENSPLRPVDCLLIGLDWQYPKKQSTSSSNSRPQYDREDDQNGRRTSTRRPSIYDEYTRSTLGYDRETSSYGSSGGRRTSSRRPSTYDESDRTTTSRYDEESYFNSRQTSRRPSIYDEYTKSTTPGDYQYDKDASTSSYVSSGRRTTSRRPSTYDEGDRTTTSRYDEASDLYSNRRTSKRPSIYDEYTKSTTPGEVRSDRETSSSTTSSSSFGSNWKSSSTRRSSIYDESDSTTSRYNSGREEESDPYSNRRTSSRRPSSFSSAAYQPLEKERERRETRDSSSTSEKELSGRREDTDSIKAKSMFLKTGDTQPYCAYHYQVVLELNEPFAKKKPAVSLLLQDSGPENEHRRNSGSSSSSSRRRSEQNSLSHDSFGNKFNDKMYTHLITSGKKLKKIDHATLLFREPLPDGFKLLKALHVNYMSHKDPEVRQGLSSRLCPVKTDSDRSRDSTTMNRFYFEPCDDRSDTGYQPTSRRPYRNRN